MTATQIIYKLETEILLNIVRLLAKGADESATWQAEKLAELGTLRTLNKKAIETNLKKAIELALTELRSRGAEEKKRIDEDLFAFALPPTADAQLYRIWETWEGLLRNNLLALGATMLEGAEQVYIDAAKKATAQALSGQKTLREAIVETVKGFDNGLKVFKDQAGRNWTAEAYAQMIIRSNIRQTVTETSFAALESADIDLVEISSHIGARPLCAPYQGHVYSRSGRDPKYPPLSSTSYGQAAGLFGINCTHKMYLYIEGTERTYKPYPEAKNDKAYAESQKQRAIEREIRKAKRENDIKKVLTKQKEMREFIKQTERTRRYEREQI